MSMFLILMSGVFLAWALFSSFGVLMAKQVAFAQVCQMLWAVVAVGLALFFQRASHRWADENRNPAKPAE